MVSVAVFPMHHLEKMRDEGLRTRDAHLIQALNRHPRVERLFVIDRPVTRAERLLGRRSGAEHARGVAGELGLDRVQAVHVETPAIVRPLRRRSLWWLDAYEPPRMTRDSAHAVARAVSSAALSICFVPTAHRLWGETPTIFDLLDNWLIHPQLGAREPTLFRREYESSFRKATWVSANAEGTRELAAEFGRDALLLPNGVDPSFFAERARQHADEWRTRLAPHPRPWLLYAGKMQDRLDVDLLRRLRDSVEGTILLAGPVLNPAWIKPLRSLHGVVWLGDIAYVRLPGLMAVADVGLIPHRLSAQVGGDPLKAHEYAAVGTRFVSTAIGGADRLRTKGIIAASDDEFVAVVAGLGLDQRALEQRIRAAVVSASDTWDAKADALLEVARVDTEAA